jgi:hypothetical protein
LAVLVEELAKTVRESTTSPFANDMSSARLLFPGIHHEPPASVVAFVAPPDYAQQPRIEKTKVPLTE